MEYHPYSNIWPLLEGDDFEKLKADIEAHGVRIPIVTYRGKLLDGRNRERACEALGITAFYAKAKVKNDAEALDLVVSLNDKRRHMSVAQLAFAASRLANILHGHNRHREKVDIAGERSTSATVSIRQAAERIGASWGSASRARTIHLRGTPQDETDVLAGRVSLTNRAAALTKHRPSTPCRAAAPAKPLRGHFGRKIPPILSKMRREASHYLCRKCGMPPFDEIKKALFPIVKELERLGNPDHTIDFNPKGVVYQATLLRNLLTLWDKELTVPRAASAQFHETGANGEA